LTVGINVGILEGFEVGILLGLVVGCKLGSLEGGEVGVVLVFHACRQMPVFRMYPVAHAKH